MEAACHYLQPVMEAVWTLVSVHALNVEVVREVKRDNEARINSNDVLTGHGVGWVFRVSWTGQMSLWLIKYTTVAGYWATEKKAEIIQVHDEYSVFIHSPPSAQILIMVANNTVNCN